MEGKTYEAQSDYAGGTALAIDQEAYNSLIGRIGMERASGSKTRAPT
ncbi:MAG: hypothetical protein ACLR1D_05515 [Dialister sp.]